MIESQSAVKNFGEHLSLTKINCPTIYSGNIQDFSVQKRC